jgi:hypothetical protein
MKRILSLLFTVLALQVMAQVSPQADMNSTANTNLNISPPSNHEALIPWMTVKVNGQSGYQVVSLCQMKFSFNQPGAGSGNTYDLKVIDATVNNLTCPVLPSACSISPVMTFTTTSGSMEITYDNNTGIGIDDVGNQTVISSGQRLITNHKYVVICCVEGSPGSGWGGANGSCVNFLYTCTPILPCSCLGWTPYVVKFNGTNHKVDCGGTIHVPLNTPYVVSTSINCSKPTCGKTYSAMLTAPNGISIPVGTGSGPGVTIPVTSTAPGNFTLTLSGKCGGISKCKDCVLHIIVDGPPCKCGVWGPFIANKTAYKPETPIAWKCRHPFAFTSTHTCIPAGSHCGTTNSWVVKLGNSTIASGSTLTGNINGSFTPTSNGTYIITLNATCGGVPCKPVTYIVSIKDCRITTTGEGPK